MFNKLYEEKWTKARELAISVCETVSAQFTDLTMKLDLKPTDPADHPLGLDLLIPRQDKLRFDVDINLQEDELLLCAGEHFWVEWFPCYKEEVVDEFRQVVIGLLNGTYRIVEYYRGKYYLKGELQCPKGRKWKTIETHGNLLSLPPFTPWWLPLETKILQNTAHKHH